MLNNILSESVYFGMVLSIAAFWLGAQLKKRWNYSMVNPLLIATILIIIILAVFRIDYETYNYGAQYLTYLLTPATVCLAVPLYKQLDLLLKNAAAIFAGILCGCITHILVVVGIAFLMKADKILMLSTLPKSVTTAIALGISGEIGGIASITVIGVTVAGIMGAVIGPFLLRLFQITEPIAQGLGIGTGSHAAGTSKAVELGEIQAAMSSLAIVVTGLMSVILVPFAVSLLG